MSNYTLKYLLDQEMITEEMLELNPALKTLVESFKICRNELEKNPLLKEVIVNEGLIPITNNKKKLVVETDNCKNLEEIFAMYEKKVGEYVYLKGNVNDYLASNAVSICRRRFKKKDIMMLILLDEDNDYDGEAGIVFTDTALFYWLEDDNFECEIKYSDIKSVDFYDESIVVETKDDKNYEIIVDFGDEDEKYSRYMYNMVMDIKEMLEERL